MEVFIAYILYAAALYLILGLIFTFFLFWKGLERLDKDVKNTSLWFKVLILPGMCLFWIVFLRKYITS